MLFKLITSFYINHHQYHYHHHHYYNIRKFFHFKNENIMSHNEDISNVNQRQRSSDNAFSSNDSNDDKTTIGTTTTSTASTTTSITKTTNIIPKVKTIIFVRHGVTDMNERLKSSPWYSESFVDAGLYDKSLYDTKLSIYGKQHIKKIHEKLKNDKNNDYPLDKIQILIASPLTRTLQTSELLFFHTKNLNILSSDIKKLSHPLFRERLYLSSEVGRFKHELEEEFPTWDFSYLPSNQKWWYCYDSTAGSSGGSSSISSDIGNNDDDTLTSVFQSSSSPIPTSPSSSLPSSSSSTTTTIPPYIEWRPPGKYCCEGEPHDVFYNRMIECKQYILSRPEDYICIVAHWGVLRALTGLAFENCEMKVISSTDLLNEPFIDKH